MSLLDDLKKRGTDLAGQAVGKLFENEQRAQQIGEFVSYVQRSKKSVDALQEAALRGLGLASSGDVKAAGKRLAVLRKSARKLDDKLSALVVRAGRGGSGN